MRSSFRGFSFLFGPVVAAACLLCVALPASGQFYTFSSGPSGDGFDWPASPTGLLDGDDFFTDDGIDIYNYVGNSVFFDQQYQVVGNGSRISGDALWGNPTSSGDDDIVFDFFSLENGGAQTVDFDFAWSQAGVPEVFDSLTFFVEDSEGRFAYGDWTLDESFTGFGGGTGYEGRVSLDASSFMDDQGGFEGGDQFIDIALVDIYIGDIIEDGMQSEFAIDNFSIDGSTPIGEDNLYPSVNGGETNATGFTFGHSVLGGTGTYGMGIEVTNDSDDVVNFSTEIVPGGDLAAGDQVSGALIDSGASLFNPGIVTVDRSLPTGTYQSDVTIINDSDPADPDNTVTVSANILDAPSLSGNFPSVDVLAGQTVDLSNAAAVAAGFRASVEVTGTTSTGGFAVQGYDVDTPVKPGEAVQGSVTFDRYGQLSGNRSGTFTASLYMTAFSEFNNDLEIVLGEAEAVPDQVWNLSYNLADTNTDIAAVSVNGLLAKSVGVNNAAIAATLLDGQSVANQNISMAFTTDPGTNAELAGAPVELTFSSGNVDNYVLQFTYDDSNVPSGSLESDLQVLVYDTIAGEWEAAVDNNTFGTSLFFDGSYEDYLESAGGIFDTVDLGVFGVDAENNHAWAILDHASTFALGVLTSGLLGDFDTDGDVDGADFLAWQRNTSVGNLADWENSYGGGGVLTASTAVPEPTSLTFIAVCLTLLTASQRPTVPRSC